MPVCAPDSDASSVCCLGWAPRRGSCNATEEEWRDVSGLGIFLAACIMSSVMLSLSLPGHLCLLTPTNMSHQHSV